MGIFQTFDRPPLEGRARLSTRCCLTFPEQIIGRADPVLYQLLALIQGLDALLLDDIHLLQQGHQPLIQQLLQGPLQIAKMLLQHISGQCCTVFDLNSGNRKEGLRIKAKATHVLFL